MALTRRIYPTRFGQLHVRSNGGKGVPLVLLHPSPRSGEMWEPLQRRLARPTFAPDRLGYGFSDAPPWALTLEQYAHCTLDALNAAGLVGPSSPCARREARLAAPDRVCAATWVMCMKSRPA